MMKDSERETRRLADCPERIESVLDGAWRVTLNKSYRSTWEIMQFALKIFPYPDLIAIERHGPEPDVQVVKTIREATAQIAAAVEDFRASDHTSLAMLAKTQAQAKRLHKALVDAGTEARLLEEGTRATLETIAAAHRRLGTAAIVPTLITDTPAQTRAAFAAKRGSGEIFLVTDAMAPAGTDLARFALNGRKITRRDRAVRQGSDRGAPQSRWQIAISLRSLGTAFTQGLRILGHEIRHEPRNFGVKRAHVPLGNPAGGDPGPKTKMTGEKIVPDGLGAAGCFAVTFSLGGGFAAGEIGGKGKFDRKMIRHHPAFRRHPVADVAHECRNLVGGGASEFFFMCQHQPFMRHEFAHRGHEDMRKLNR